VVTRVATIGAAMVAVLVAGLLLARRSLADLVFSGQVAMVVVLAVGLVAAAAIYVTRGLLAGTQRYWTYAGQLAGEGTLRVAVAVAIGLAGAGSALRLGVVVALAPAVVLAATLVVLPRPGGRPRAGNWAEVSANLGWLVLASASSYGVSNAGPVVLQLLGNDDPGLAGRFLAAFVLVRIPLFFTAALQASLLPRLVTAVEAGDRPAFVAALRSMIGVVGGLGLVALAGFAAVGPLAVRLLFGPRYPAERIDLVLLGFSSVVFVLATMLQSGVLALGGHRAVAGFWLGGGLVFAGCCLLPLAPITRLDLGYCASALVVLGLMLARLARVRPDRLQEAR
jgi:O-antigen/teichoic acid export membrane protein